MEADEAIRMFAGEQYHSAVLRPAVTQFTFEMIRALDDWALPARDRFCSETGTYLLAGEVIRKKR
jgi:hypothetical protein